MQGLLQEADIRAGLTAGGRIESVVIVARRDEAAGVEHVPYLLPSWRRGYVAIGLFRGAGVRAYRDLTRLVRFVRDDLGYRGPVTLHEQDCPKLSKLRSVAAGATSSSAALAGLPQAAGGHDTKQDTPDT
ncbi:hypothetical protein D9599_19250 [Roseomonas sp. KE2513]|uniref:hypothetical protein n=1 Tax=Roseomonas sp. KE2513 TaxID=2479202 RepID=UPI0018DEF7E3|nr:hypothetical protein [Roseomonas sp. KE2513]MBI0537701.1 hypothetical protein [Roseomonas sp. KE2513]